MESLAEECEKTGECVVEVPSQNDGKMVELQVYAELAAIRDKMKVRESY